MDIDEIKDTKDAVKAIKEHWEGQKKAVDKLNEELKEGGKATAATLEKLGKMEGQLQTLEKLQKRLEDVENFARRQGTKAATKDGVELPEDHAEANKAWTEFVRQGKNTKGTGVDAVFKWEGAVKDGKKSMSVLSDPDGGYMVVNDYNGQVVKKVFETSDMRKVASVTSIGTGALEGVIDRDEAGAEWVGETTAPSTTGTPQIGKWKIPVWELRAKTLVTLQMLEDSMIAVEPWLADKQGDKFARSENTTFVSGDGNGKPRGFLDYAAATPVVGGAWKSLEILYTGSAAALLPDAIISLIYALKGPYRANASFACTRLTIAAIRKLKDTQNRYLWEPSLQVGTPSSLLGHSLNEFADMPEVAADALALAFGDFRAGYQIVDRLGISTLRDNYTADPYVKFISRKRVGGDVIDFDAIKLLKCHV